MLKISLSLCYNFLVSLSLDLTVYMSSLHAMRAVCSSELSSQVNNRTAAGNAVLPFPGQDYSARSREKKIGSVK